MLVLILLLCAPVAGAAPLQDPAPPPPPTVPPIISVEYPEDRDGDRINDDLQGSSAKTGGLVGVELIFREPITQQQIDAFLGLGGQITYIYQAISYGWNGRIRAEAIGALPAALGPSLVQVEGVHEFELYMDTATQVGRVRPVWKAGFAQHPNGLCGSPNTTIAFVGDGVDGTHKDLSGRCVYWKDFTDDNEPMPVDFYGHDSVVAGVAVGTGQAGGAETGELRYTLSDPFSSPNYLVEPISLPSGPVTVTSEASWMGDKGLMAHLRWRMEKDVPEDTGVIGRTAGGSSPLVLTNTFIASGTEAFAVLLSYRVTFGFLEDAVINVTVSSYPGVGDGFNKFRGVAPGCKWAAAKVFEKNGDTRDDTFKAALDDFVQHRIEKNIKIITISHGLYGRDDLPAESVSLRSKINSLVNNGIVVVAAAGNRGKKEFEAERKMADPARAALAITVGASNDQNLLTSYSTYGFSSPRTDAGEDFKPDLLAPGGSLWCTSIMSVDSGTSDGRGPDKVPDDYANLFGTSFAAPFVAGCAALVIEALEQEGIPWNYHAPDQPKLVKMLLCATASETNAGREGKDALFNPPRNRVEGDADTFPAGKDAYEGYGLVNADAAVEALSLTHVPGSLENIELGGNAAAKRVWARTVNLKAGCDLDVALDNPAGADADLCLYSMTPSSAGTPLLLASSTNPNAGREESLHYAPVADAAALLVVRRVSGAGTFVLHSTQAVASSFRPLSPAGHTD